MQQHGHSGHDHSNEHTIKNKNKLGIILILTTVYMIAEFVGGYFSNSLALVADAGHMLSDVGALALSFFALWLYLKPASAEKTYGYYRMEILAAFVNGLALVVISLLIMYEAYQRFLSPSLIKAPLMITIAIGGLIINLIGILLLHKSCKENLNIQGAFLHILGDLLGSVGAIIAGVMILVWKFYLADPIISVIISALILYSAINLINEAINILLEASPAHINVELLRKAILELDEIEDVHDLHVWSISSSSIALSTHVVTKSKDYNKILSEVQDLLNRKFQIDHLTIQVEGPEFKELKCIF